MPSSDNPKGFRKSNYANPTLSMRFQPIPPPFNIRVDSQRIIAGQQFTGSIPDEDQGKWGDVGGPSEGGRWMWSDDVIMERFEFRSNGVEPGTGRSGDSGLYIVRKGGVEHRILDLSDTTTAILGTLEYLWLSDPVAIKQGDMLRLRTTGATLEMQAMVSVKTSRVYL